VASSRIEVLPPWSLDESLRYDDIGRESFRLSHGLNGKFVVMYSGNHSPCHPLTTLLGAAALMRSRQDVAFVFIGGGSEHQTVRRFAAEHQLPNVLVLPYQPLERLPSSLSAADLHVVIMGDPFVGMVHPSKVYNIRALGIPYLYIGPSESHVTDLDPSYSSVHGDVAGVAGHIEAAVAAGAGRRDTAALVTSSRHSRPLLLNRLVFALERAAGLPSKASVVQVETTASSTEAGSIPAAGHVASHPSLGHRPVGLSE
jgi:hypothetical protein